MSRIIVVAGGRDFDDYEKLKEVLDSMNLSCEDTIVSGTARGADSLGEIYALENNIHLLRLPANWTKFGKSAGFKRNVQMAEIATEGVIFWDGKSRGSQNMIYQLSRLNKPKTIVYYKNK